MGKAERLRRLVLSSADLTRPARLAWIILLLATSAATAADPGRIRGQVVREDGSPVGGVAVILEGASASPAVTDFGGRFSIENVEAGTYSLVFVLGSNNAVKEGVEVVAAQTTEIRLPVDWAFSFAETLTVVAASRRVERVVDAPAAVSVVTPEQIEREASTGQLPKLLESAPGAEITQSGLYDFKLNLRGLNSMLNRRVAVLVDGRNPSLPLLGAQEWAAVGFPLNDLAGAELVRGPSSALYGANAFNGVLNLITKSPRNQQGGFARLTGGELDTFHLDLGIYSELGSGWYFKGLAGYRGSDDFSRSRNQTVEYSVPCVPGLPTIDCLPIEGASLPLDRIEIPFGSVRFDKELSGGSALVMEAGTANTEGPVLASSSGRFQLVDVERPWSRINFNSSRWNLLAYYTGRDAEALTLAAGSPSYTNSDRFGLELQGRWSFANDRGRLVAGASFVQEDVDTADPNGVETLLAAPVNADFEAVFGQFDFDVNDKLKVVVAGRVDDSSLFSAEFSPKASLVYGITPAHTLRAGFNQAFLSANYPEFSVRVPLAPPFDLSFLEAMFCAPSEVSCGFDEPLPFLAVGNNNLTVEKIRTLEAGYRGFLGERTFLTVEIFHSEIEDFIRSGIPLVGTVLGRANPDFGPYSPPAGLPADAAAGLLASLEGILTGFLFPFLSNPVADEPLIAFLTLVNAGSLETDGVEIALESSFEDRWSFDFNYSWLDFSFQEQLPSSPLGFNSPEHKFNLGIQYIDDRFAGALRYRWVDSFRFTEGVVNGVVGSYGVVNLVTSYQLSDEVEIGLNVSNLLDNVHYEVFQGDLLERRALAHVAYRW